MAEPVEIRIYRGHGGQPPFSEWLKSHRDRRTVAIIETKLSRVRLGNFGDAKSVGGGVEELRIDYGPGYRIYFGRDGRTVVVLLCGGDKRSQRKDIETAKAYWRDYLDDQD